MDSTTEQPKTDGAGSLALNAGSASGLREMGAKIIEAVMDGETRPLAIAALACEGLQFGDAVRIARGCLDYGGGYRGDNGKMEIFHHGIQTVINSLEAAQKRGLQDTQVAALHAMGKPNVPDEPTRGASDKLNTK